jgi:hypothetical protein
MYLGIYPTLPVRSSLGIYPTRELYSELYRYYLDTYPPNTSGSVGFSRDAKTRITG